MGLVSIKIDGRLYTLSCADGKEPYIESCAANLDARAKQMKAAVGAVPENMLLCLLSLTLVDELNKAKEQEKTQTAAPSAPPPPSLPETSPPPAPKTPEIDLETLVETLNQLSEKLEQASKN